MPVLSIRKQHSRMMVTVKVLTLINLVLLAVAFYLFLTEPPAVTRAIIVSQGKTYSVPMRTLSMPIINRNSLLQWARDAATAAYTFNAANYKQALGKVVHTYFTSEGGDAFVSALENSGLIDEMLSKKLVVTAVVNGYPLILKQGNLLGRYSWRIQVPLLVTYQSASEKETNLYIVTMLAVLTDPRENPLALGIDQFKVSKAL